MYPDHDGIVFGIRSRKHVQRLAKVRGWAKVRIMVTQKMIYLVDAHCGSENSTDSATAGRVRLGEMACAGNTARADRFHQPFLKIFVFYT